MVVFEGRNFQESWKKVRKRMKTEHVKKYEKPAVVIRPAGLTGGSQAGWQAWAGWPGWAGWGWLGWLGLAGHVWG